MNVKILHVSSITVQSVKKLRKITRELNAIEIGQKSFKKSKCFILSTLTTNFNRRPQIHPYLQYRIFEEQIGQELF